MMKKELAIFFGIFALVAIAVYVYVASIAQVQPAAVSFDKGKEITSEQFSQVILGASTVSIVYYAEKDQAKNQVIINNCTIPLSYSLAAIGKNVTAYMFQDGACTWSDSASGTKTSAQETCMREIAGYLFSIRYGKSPAKFYEMAADIYVDESFGSECSITLGE